MIRITFGIVLYFILPAQGPSVDLTAGGRRTGPFSFMIYADKPLYRLGDTITVTSVLRNESDRDITISMTPRVSFYGKDLRLPGPAWLPFRSQASLSEEGEREVFPLFTSATRYVVKPGQDIVDKFVLSKLYTMPITGDYRLTFFFRAPDSVGKDVMIVSNELIITVGSAQ